MEFAIVILHAFIESNVCAIWIEILRGDTLRQLDSINFNYFKSFYGVENLSISRSFVDSCNNYEDNGYYDYIFEY